MDKADKTNSEMDKRGALKIAKFFLRGLPKKYSTKKAYLFGSYAKGTAHSDSDIDIALILPECENLFDVRVGLMQISRKIDLSIEPHPMAEEDFEEGNPLAEEIKKYGILL